MNLLTLFSLSPEKCLPVLPCSRPVSYRVPKGVPIETMSRIPAFVHPRPAFGNLDCLKVTCCAIRFKCLAEDKFMTKAPAAVGTPYARLRPTTAVSIFGYSRGVLKFKKRAAAAVAKSCQKDVLSPRVHLLAKKQRPSSSNSLSK